MVRGLLRLCVGLGSEPDEGARTWPLWPCRSAPAPQSTGSASLHGQCTKAILISGVDRPPANWPHRALVESASSPRLTVNKLAIAMHLPAGLLARLRQRLS